MSTARIEVPPSALIVIAGKGNAETLPLARSLRDAGFPSFCNSNCRTQLAHVHQLRPDLIVLDAASADEFYCGVQGYERLEEIPTIHIVLPDNDSRAKAFAAGAADCIVKPVIAQELLACVKTQLGLRALQMQLDTSIATVSAS